MSDRRMIAESNIFLILIWYPCVNILSKSHLKTKKNGSTRWFSAPQPKDIETNCTNVLGIQRHIKIHRNHKYHWRLIWDFFDECFGIRQIWRRSRNWIQCYLDLLQCNDSYIYCRLFMFWIIWIQTVLLVTSRINNYTFVNLLKIGPRITCRFPQHQKVSFRSSMCRNRFWWWFSLQVDYMIEQIILWEAWSILVMSPVIKLAICWY